MLDKRLAVWRFNSFARTLFYSTILGFTFSCSENNKPSQNNPFQQLTSQNIMSASALLPADLSEQMLGCPIANKVQSTSKSKSNYLNSEKIEYSKSGWENRVASDWRFFSASPQQGKILLIDIKPQQQQLVYRYIANNTHNELFEAWSASKIMAITAAMAKARNTGLGGVSRVGNIPLADLITSIHSYSKFGQSKASSNAIATYFVNLVGRQKLSQYFHQDWLKLNNPQVRITGGYGEPPFQPQPELWFNQDNPYGIAIEGYQQDSDDPFSQSYRCESCGLTGNKPQTTLSMAEWLKRLAVHDRDGLTKFPGLDTEDLEVLFYGKGHSQAGVKVAGMMQGISLSLALAMAKSIDPQASLDVKNILDQATNGQWRIWQKIGWGPSETRGAAEYVVLAHVCLPHYQGGKEFTLSAQVAIPGATEADQASVGLKMQDLLEQSMREYFAIQHD